MSVEGDPRNSGLAARLAAARHAPARADSRLTGAIADLFLDADARLDERIRYDVEYLLGGIIRSLAADIRRHAARVSAIPGVASHLWDARTGTLSIQTTDVAGTLGEVLALGREHGIPILNLDIERPSLEDVFLSHTGKDLRE